MGRKILFATDYSELSEEALDVATRLAKDEDAVLLIVHVSETEKYPIGEPCVHEPQPFEPEVEELKTVVPADPTVRYEHRLAYGEPGSVEHTKPAEVIVKVAEEEGADMIVLATHGRKGLAHLLMGDVAEEVMRNAPCPVVAVRHRVAAEAAQ